MDGKTKKQKTLDWWSLVKKHIFIYDEGTSKRQDIQGLRAVAITLVLGFHFLPLHFPNGYLGVDMFFVLSGYLMGLVLSRHERMDMKITVDFYYRRLKRILPTFYLVVLLTLVAMFFVLSIPYIPDNRDAAIAALTFSMNWAQLLRKDDYFAIEKFHELFKHTWSLSVELQFYLVLPLIFFIQKNILKEQKLRSAAFLGVLAVASFGYHCYLNDDRMKQFHNSFGRGWQFLLGMLAFHVSLRKQNSALPEENNRHSAFFLSLHLNLWMLFLFGVWQPTFSSFLPGRVLATVLTAVYLVVGSYNQTILLSNGLFEYIGDLSYVLYLTHWPCLMLVQYAAPWHDMSTEYAKLLAFALSLTSALLIHHFFEKVHLEWEKLANMVLILVLFVTSFTVALYAELLDTPFLGPNREPIRTNMVLMHPIYRRNDTVYIPIANTTDALSEFPAGNGTLKVLVMGDSYARQHIHIVKKVLAGRYKSLHMMSMLGSQVMTNANERVRDVNLAAVKLLKPDLLIVTIRYGEFLKAPVQPEDPLTQEGIEVMRNFSRHCNHILIGSPHPRFPHHYLNHFIDRLQRNLTVDDLHLNLDTVRAETAEAWKRTREIVKSCRKCSILDTYRWFVDRENNRILMFEPLTKLSYADNTVHFTHKGLEKMEPLYRNLLEPMIRRYERKAKKTPKNHK